MSDQIVVRATSLIGRTCFFVIGLLSTTQMGAEILEEYGWMATRTHLGRPTGLCLPNDIGRFTSVSAPPSHRDRADKQIEPWSRPDTTSMYPPLPALEGTEGEIITAIANLSNYVLAAGAMNNLKRFVMLLDRVVCADDAGFVTGNPDYSPLCPSSIAQHA